MADGERMVLHRLALRLGKTIGELLDMDEQEFIDWVAYLDIEAENRGR